MEIEKENVHNSALALLKGSEMVYYAFENRIFSMSSKKSEESKESANHFHQEFVKEH